MALAPFLGLPLPLLAIQILWINLVTDGAPALSLGVEPAHPRAMKQPPRDPDAGVFTRSVVTLMLVGGVWSSLANLALFAWALESGRGLTLAMTMTFVSLVLIEFIKAQK